MDRDSPIDWQSRYLGNSERLSHLYQTKTRADCTFLVGSDNPEIITAHKFVLAMSSPVFETMFYGSWPEDSGPIKVPDIRPEVFKLLLMYIYTDYATIMCYKTATELYYAAKKYMIQSIQRNCSDKMLILLMPQNACYIYEFANLFEVNHVLAAALQTMKRKTKEVLKRGTFYDASIETVAVVFSQPELNINSEVDLFRAAEKYAESCGLKTLKRNYEPSFQIEAGTSKKLKIEEIDGSITEHHTTLELPNNDEQDSDEKIIKDMRKAISHIRFLTLSAQELASVASSALLTEDEAFSLMLIAAGVDEPLPPGFCDSKVRRGLRKLSPTPSSPANFPATNSQQLSGGGSEATYECICQFNVPNFKTRKRRVDCNFSTDTYEWKLHVEPDTQITLPGDQKTLSVHVECFDRTTVAYDRNWRCAAAVTLEIVGRGKPPLRRSFNYTYTGDNKIHGFRHWLPWSTVCESGSGYLHGNTFKIIARVAATVSVRKPAT